MVIPKRSFEPPHGGNSNLWAEKRFLLDGNGNGMNGLSLIEIQLSLSVVVLGADTSNVNCFGAVPVLA